MNRRTLKTWIVLTVTVTAPVFLFLLLPGLTLFGQDQQQDRGEQHKENSSRQEDLTKLRKEFRQKVERLETLRKQHYSKLREREDRIQRHTGDLNTLRTKKSALETEVKQQEEHLQSLQSRLKSLQQKKNSLVSLQQNLEDLASRVADRLEEHLSRSAPYRIKSRKNRLNEIMEQAEEDEQQTTPVERLNLLWQFSMDEFRDGRTSEVYTKRIALPDGRRKYARLVRIGHRLLMFVTEDHKQVGLAVHSPDSGWEWRSGPVAERRKRVMDAMEIILERQSPRRVLLPLDLHRFFTGSGGD